LYFSRLFFQQGVGHRRIFGRKSLIIKIVIIPFAAGVRVVQAQADVGDHALKLELVLHVQRTDAREGMPARDGLIAIEIFVHRRIAGVDIGIDKFGTGFKKMVAVQLVGIIHPCGVGHDAGCIA